MNDHDLLVVLHERIKAIGEDLREIKNTTQKEIEDHEKRIRILEENAKDYNTVKKLVYGAVGTILITALGAIISLIIKK